jgi:tRNA nucleotidyltransferase (CCA-adding enzyme)
MPGIVTLAGESFEPDLPKRLLSIANEIRNAGGRAF